MDYIHLTHNSQISDLFNTVMNMVFP